MSLEAESRATRKQLALTIMSGVSFAAAMCWQGLHAGDLLAPFHSHQPGVLPAPVPLALLAASIAAAAPMFLPRAVRAARSLRADMNVLVTISLAGAIALGEWGEGAAVAFLFVASEWIETFALARAHKEARIHGGWPAAYLDEASPGRERWIETFARRYTPVMIALALAVALLPPLAWGNWTEWLYRSLIVLLISCPCALVISTPVTVSAAIASAAHQGVLIRGGAALEQALRGPDPAGFLGHHARRTMRIIRQNVGFAIGIKLVFLILTFTGTATLWMAVLADTGATLLVTLNGLRMLQARV